MNNPPSIGAAESAHHIRAGAGRPKQRHQTDKRRRDGHRLGPDAFHRAVVHRVPQVLAVFASAPRPVNRSKLLSR